MSWGLWLMLGVVVAWAAVSVFVYWRIRQLFFKHWRS